MNKLVFIFLFFSLPSLGKSKVEWYKQDSLWEIGREFETGVFKNNKKNKAENAIKSLVNFANFNLNGIILELGCGEGFHAGALAKEGFQIKCIDVSPFMLSQAKINLRNFNQKILLEQKDMLDLNEPERFDAVVTFGHSFGYFDSPEKNVQVLRNVYKSLKKGGKFFMEIYGKEIIDRVYPKTLIKEKNGKTLIRLTRIVNNYSNLESYFYLIDKNNIKFLEQHSQLYSAQELTNILEQIGFKIIGVYGSYDKRPYDNTSDSLMILSEK